MIATPAKFCVPLLTASSVMVMQSGRYGQLGNSTSNDQKSPVLATGNYTFSAVAIAGMHTCALTLDRKTVCWGSSPGNGQASDTNTPAEIQGREFVALTAGLLFSCAIDTLADMYCWGASACSCCRRCWCCAAANCCRCKLPQAAAGAAAGAAAAAALLPPLSCLVWLQDTNHSMLRARLLILHSIRPQRLRRGHSCPWMLIIKPCAHLASPKQRPALLQGPPTSLQLRRHRPLLSPSEPLLAASQGV